MSCTADDCENMPSVAIVTDSTMYLPPALVQSLGIEQISLYYDLGDGPLRELDSEGDFGRFYADLVLSGEMATTSPPSLEDFTSVYERLLAKGASVVSIHLSSGLSDTCTIAREAAAVSTTAHGTPERVVVIDSAGACGHLAVQVLAAARGVAAGEDAQRVVERVRQARQEVKMWFLFETLEYLRRGGRIGSAAAWIGSALDIKPILTIESEIRAVERVRTRRRGIERLIELMRQRRSQGADRWFVQHAQCEGEAQEVAARLSEIFVAAPEFISEVGPVVGTYSGPGMLIVGCLPSAVLR